MPEPIITASQESSFVTPFIRAHPERFKISCYKYPKDLSHYRWVVDEPADLDFAKKIFENLYPLNLEFGMGDILTLLDKMPELLEINQQFRRNEGEKKSIGKDAHFFSGMKAMLFRSGFVSKPVMG